MTFNIFKKDEELDELELELDGDAIEEPEDEFCDPEKPRDWCHFKDLSYDGVPMKRMRSAHTYFYVINLINLLAPSGYWFVWVWFKIDPMTNIMPVITTIMEFVGSIATFSELLAPTISGDYDGSGVVDSTDQDYLEDELTTFTDGLTDLMDSFTGIIALFTWPIAAACLLSSFNSLASYWPLALF